MNPARILIVDDNDINLKLAASVLEYAGYEIFKAGDAVQALEIVGRTMPDLILMDMALPGMDGLELTRKLKADAATRDIRVVALTASVMKGDAQKAADAGCEGYIPKPIDTRQLARQVAEILGKAPERGKGN
jgi:CheY-like chemotaxis protein